MRDRHTTTVADAARAARDDDPGPWPETPSREDVAEFEGPRPFEVPPGSERQGGWWLVRPEYRHETKET